MTSEAPKAESRVPDSFHEQRGFTRYALWFPVRISVTDAPELGAICRDASASGILVSSPRALEKGVKVTLRFRVAREGAVNREVDAEVVRSSTNDDDLVLAFPYRLALRFASPIPELPDELASRVGVGE
jgi:hypothetical protein